MDSEKLQTILDRYLKGTASIDETMLIERWYRMRSNVHKALSKEEKMEIGAAMKEQILKSLPQTKNKTPLFQKIYFRLAVAASLAALLIACFWLVSRNRHSNLAIGTNTFSVPESIVPGSNKAMLTLDDGKQIILNDRQHGMLANEGNVKIMQSRSGHLSYVGQENDLIANNRLSTPTGGQYQLALPDGTQVWLNAASSISFPISFTGNNRVVAITGEAYFEVAHIEKKPFVVETNGMKITVLGTHFNVNAYPDEAAIRTVLLQGSIQLSKDGKIALLAQGQQATIAQGSSSIAIDSADTLQATSWKNGYFSFDGNDSKSVMRQLARWYDVDIVFNGSFEGDNLRGQISRSESLQHVLEMLQMTGIGHFSVRGRTITISR